MTEKEVEMAYKKMTESDAPDLWARVESNLPEKEIQPEMKVKKGSMAIGIQDQYFGTEIEMTGITRQRAAEKVAELFGTRAVCNVHPGNNRN